MPCATIVGGKPYACPASSPLALGCCPSLTTLPILLYSPVQLSQFLTQTWQLLISVALLPLLCLSWNKIPPSLSPKPVSASPPKRLSLSSPMCLSLPGPKCLDPELRRKSILTRCLAHRMNVPPNWCKSSSNNCLDLSPSVFIEHSLININWSVGHRVRVKMAC